MQFTVEYHDGIFICTTSGEAEADQFGELIDIMLTHNEWKTDTPWIHDHSSLNAKPLATEDIRLIAQFCKDRRTEIGKGKCAIVVPKNLEFGLARMWEAFIGDDWYSDSDVFRSKKEALAWINTE